MIYDPDGRDIVPVNETSDKAMESHLVTIFGEDVGYALYDGMHEKNNRGAWHLAFSFRF